MTVVNKLLNDVAKALNSESFDVPAYASFATSNVDAIVATDTSLSGEIGTRVALTKSRTDNALSLTGVRSGANVVDTTNGDILESTGINAAATGTDLQAGIVLNTITHTTAFDIEILSNIEVNRR